MTTPELGDDVIVVGVHSTSTHTRQHPAKVTAVHPKKDDKTPHHVNLHIFVDGMPSQPCQGVPFFENLQEASNESKGRMPFCYLKPPKG